MTELQNIKDNRLTIMVSSTVYGIEELLELIYVTLTNLKYEVWMSHKGTIPVFSNKSAFENSIAAVEKCNLFLGIITTNYGSGKKDNEEKSITHKELLKAIELNRPRWILAHDHVVFARALLRQLNYKTQKSRKNLKLHKSRIIDDLRVIDMYEAAIRYDIKLQNRKGNWVQKYVSDEDAQIFAISQFYRYQEVETFLKNHFGNQSAIQQQISLKEIL